MSTFKKRIAILLSVLMIASLFAVGTVSASAEEESIGAGWFVVGDAPIAPAEPETEPEPTAPPVLPAGSLKVNVSSNLSGTASASYSTKSNYSFTVAFKLKASMKITNCEGLLTYDSSLIKLDSFTVSDKLKNAVINTENYNRAVFNTTNVNSPADFSSEDVFATAKFSILNVGETSVVFTVSELTSVIDENDFVSLVSDYTIDSTKVSSSIALSEPIPEPTEPATTAKVSITPTKKTVKAGSAFTIKVKNTKKKATYSSNKKTVAAVSSAGKVTALQKGTAKITVKVNGKKYTCTVKVSNSPTAKISKKSVSSKKTYTVKKGKTITVSLAGKAASIKNSYTTSKKKIAKVISKTTAKSVKIKGLKKGTATIKIKVNKVKTFTIKVKVK